MSLVTRDDFTFPPIYIGKFDEKRKDYSLIKGAKGRKGGAKEHVEQVLF